MTIKQENARWVLNKYYAETILDLVHPGNFSALPPSPLAIYRKASMLGLVDSQHDWIGIYL